MMNISLVIPLFNEEESLSELCAQIDNVMEQNNFTYEEVRDNIEKDFKLFKVL